MGVRVAVCWAACWGVAAAVAADVAVPPLVPMPKRIEIGQGMMPLTAQSRIVATDALLAAHADVLKNEIWMLTNWKLEIVKFDPRPGDIVLKIDPGIRAEEEILAPKDLRIVRTRDMAHAITVEDTAEVRGWDVRAVCEGTATLLQSLVIENGTVRVPHMKVKDWPHADYNGTMVDCGRQWIPLDALKVLVESCRYYKVRYIQLHVGDDQGYSMPSKAFPRLGSANGSCCEGVPPKLWTWEQMEELEAYAAARGVGIVPELETPGHHQAMGRSYRDLFDGPGCMDMASEELYIGLDTVVGEMCSIFKSAPYFCIGCDEANNGTGAGPNAEIYKRRHAIPNDAQSVRNGHEIYVVHMKRMADMCRKYGKLTIAYENFPDDARLKNDIIVLTWYPHAVAQRYLQQGWTTITMPWTEEPDWSMYVCNGSRLNKGDRVLGAGSTMWQMSALCVVNGWAQNQRRTERTWGPDNKLDNAALQQRMEANRSRLDRLVLPVRMETEGVDGGQVIRMQHFLTGRMIYGGTLKVKLSVATPSGGEIRYTLDDSEPTPQSTLYSEPLLLDKTFMLNAALFVDGRQVGSSTRAKYDWNDIRGYIEDWDIAGPYFEAGKSGADLFAVEFPPEKNAEATWIPFKKPAPPEVPWMVSFDAYPGFPGDARVAYLRCQVFSPQTQSALLYVGTDDGVKAFVNGKCVHGVNAGRGVTEEDRVGIELREGWNDLLIKTNNWTGGYAAKARIRSANDGPLEGLKIKAH
jgi:hexosaminidase